MYCFSEDLESYQTTQTNELTLVTNKSEEEVKKATFGPWTTTSSEPIVRNKELDDWVPASADTRIATAPEEDYG